MAGYHYSTESYIPNSNILHLIDVHTHILSFDDENCASVQ